MSLTKVGRYQIIGELGHGAMGMVYRGFDPTIGRTVAIKTVLLDSGDPETLKRFRREAQAAGILSHPNIVTIYDAGEDHGVFYIAMELVEGETLQQILTRGPLPVEKALPIIEQVGAALDHAHARKIIHRDIKPANIMVSENLSKVMDFGIAKMTALGLTSTGQVLGTPSYMSPELVKGSPLDGRSDLFSLGVMLYETLTGNKPFTGENITTVIYKILGEDPAPPAMLNTALHAGIDYVVMKALAKDPAGRYQTCAALSADLRNFPALGAKGKAVAQAAVAAQAAAPREATGTLSVRRGDLGLAPEPAPATGTSSLLRNRRVLAAGGALLALLAAGVVWKLAGPSQAPPPQPERMVVNSPPPTGTAQKPSAFGRPAGGKSSAAKAPAAVAKPSPTRTTAMGRVAVHSDPQGARIVVDGKPTDYHTPVNFALPAGKHTIALERAGFTTASRELVVQKDQITQLKIELKPDGEKKRRRFLFR